MPRNWSKAVHDDNGLVPQQENFGPDQPTPADVCRLFEERFDKQLKIAKSRFGQQEKKLDELAEKKRDAKQRLARLDSHALTMDADVPSDTKTRERTGDAATAVQAIKARG